MSPSDLPEPGWTLPPVERLRERWARRWRATLDSCDRLGGEIAPFVLDPPLPAAELRDIERELGRPLPPSLVELFTRVAARVEVGWSLSELDPPGPLHPCGSGDCGWDARAYVELAGEMRAQAAGFAPDDAGERVWRHKLPFLRVGNGDLIAIDTGREGASPVVYLSQDGDEDAHGRVLGHSVLDFLDRWTLLACAGPEHVQLSPFLDDDQPYLDALGENAQRWRAWLGLPVLAPV